MEVVGVRGSGEHSGYGHIVGQAVSAIKTSVKSGVADHVIDYPAVGVAPWKASYNGDYTDSVDQGENTLRTFINNFNASSCGPTTYLYLIGYSQGAEVVDGVYQPLSAARKARIGGVALFGDPRFWGGQGGPIDQGTYDSNLSGITTRQFRNGTHIHFASSDAGTVRSYCIKGDPICNDSGRGRLLGCVADQNTSLLGTCAHMRYADLTFGSPAKTYTQTAADFLVSRMRILIPAAVPQPTATPAPTPDPGDSDPGRGPAAAETTWAETVGGNANTWTNPANAGGSKGETIAANQTVQIACRLTGFAVADGDTWWYRIASSPWNDGYYVSADAFYNNGSTSGSLHGTPFVDTAVATC